MPRCCSKRPKTSRVFARLAALVHRPGLLKKFWTVARATQVVMANVIPNPKQLQAVLTFLTDQGISLERCQLPLLTFCLRRYVALKSPHGCQIPLRKWLDVVERFCINCLEIAFLPGGSCESLLRSDIPEGAHVQYEYGSGATIRHTHVDPRAQVWAVNWFVACCFYFLYSVLCFLP
jgi:hypothetical protein